MKGMRNAIGCNQAAVMARRFDRPADIAGDFHGGDGDAETSSGRPRRGGGHRDASQRAPSGRSDQRDGVQQEKMDMQGLRNIDDVTRLTPGVAFSRNGTGSSANYNDESSDINIRGNRLRRRRLDHRNLHRRYAHPEPSHRFRRRQLPSRRCSIWIGSKCCAVRRERCSAPAPKAAWCVSSRPRPASTRIQAMYARSSRRLARGDASYELGAAFGGPHYRQRAWISRQRLIPPRWRLRGPSRLYAGHGHAGH